MYKILAQGKNLNLVIDNEASEYKPLIMLGTVLYDPENKLRPIEKFRSKAKQLHATFHTEALDLFAQGESLWKPSASEPLQGELIPVSAPAPKPPANSRKAVGKLETLIAQSVAQIAVEDVVETAKPMLDKFIADTYGMIPKRLEVATPTGNHVVQGIVHEKFEMVLKIVNMDIPVFLTGPAGSGKNVICKQVAEALGLEFYFSNAVTQEYKLTGFIDANGRFHETQFFKAFTGGGRVHAGRD